MWGSGMVLGCFPAYIAVLRRRRQDYGKMFLLPCPMGIPADGWVRYNAREMPTWRIRRSLWPTLTRACYDLLKDYGHSRTVGRQNYRAYTHACIMEDDRQLHEAKGQPLRRQVNIESLIPMFSQEKRR